MQPRTLYTLAALGALSLGAAGRAGAQGPARSATTDTRWTPWLGCWSADNSPSRVANGASGTTCIVPVAGSNAADALTIADNQIISRRRLDASGRDYRVDEGGCAGTESAHWSINAARIFLSAEYVCPGAVKGLSSSVFAITPAGEWIETQSVHAGGGTVDRVMRWREAPLSNALPKSAIAVINARRLAIATSRAAVSRPITADDVIEAARSVDAEAVRTWVLATGQHFTIDGAQVAALQRANVSPGVLQAMMGVDQAGADAMAMNAQNAYSEYNGMGATYTPYPSYPGYPSYPSYPSYPGYSPYGVYGGAAYGYGYGYDRNGRVGYPLVTPPVVVYRGGGYNNGRHEGRDYDDRGDRGGRGEHAQPYTPKPQQAAPRPAPAEPHPPNVHVVPESRRRP